MLQSSAYQFQDVVGPATSWRPLCRLKSWSNHTPLFSMASSNQPENLIVAAQLGFHMLANAGRGKCLSKRQAYT